MTRLQVAKIVEGWLQDWGAQAGITQESVDSLVDRLQRCDTEVAIEANYPPQLLPWAMWHWLLGWFR
jgi:hypothetical protein